MKFVTTLRPLALILAVLCLVFPAVSEGAVIVTPAQPERGESVIIESDQPGHLHWGVNGWRRPAPDDVPFGSKFQQGAMQTRLVAQNGRYSLTLGPFLNGDVQELNFAIRLDNGGWDSNGGKNYRVYFAKASKKRPITIGRGPRLGYTMGQDFYEEFQDWSKDDGRALDRFMDRRAFHDGGDDSRDLVAFYSRRENQNLYLRTDFFDLALGAESDKVNVCFLIDTRSGGQSWLPDFVHGQSSHPWELAVVVESTHSFKVYNSSWKLVCAPNTRSHLWKGAYFRSDLDAMECGLSESLLRDNGWDGHSALRFQVFTWKPGHNEIADAVAESNIYDRRLNDSISEGSGIQTAKYSAILHGNQAVKRASEIFELIRNDHVKTPNGHQTGYHRALETHQIFDTAVNIHVSGTLAGSFQWAHHKDGGFDGPSFNRWISHLVKNQGSSLIGGVLAEHIAPFFETSGVNEASVDLNHKVLQSVYGTPVPRIYWTPERVIRAATFNDIKSSGYDWTIVDQHNHIWQWYGKDQALSNNGYKINRINGVNCFLINDEPDQVKFAVTDGGAYRDTRALLLGKAMDPDQEQVVIVFDDWEAYAGRSFTSFGVGNDNPDNYNTNIRWLANHPWIQVVTLDEVAAWNWKPVERGQRSDLKMTTYHWLNHATQTDYNSWYYGSSQEESFAAQYPPLRPGQNAFKRFGDVWTPGTLFHDTWKDVQNAPEGPLKELAKTTYCTAIYETAWHDEDQHNYYDRDHAGDYLAPDTSYDQISGWAFGMHNKVRDASMIAAAAHWAHSKPSSKTRVVRQDIDQDGETETILSNNRIYAVFENDGGRIVMAFARRLSDGSAYPVIGASIVDPGAHRESEIEGNFRISGLRDQWASGASTARYINAHYNVKLQSNSVTLTSDDGKIEKTIALADGSDRLNVSYRTDSSLGKVYVRSGFCPNLLGLFSAGQGAMKVSGTPGRIGVRTELGGVNVQGMIESPTVTGQIQDSAFNNGRNAALTQQLELSGQGSFQFTIILSAW